MKLIRDFLAKEKVDITRMSRDYIFHIALIVERKYHMAIYVVLRILLSISGEVMMSTLKHYTNGLKRESLNPNCASVATKSHLMIVPISQGNILGTSTTTNGFVGDVIWKKMGDWRLCSFG